LYIIKSIYLIFTFIFKSTALKCFVVPEKVADNKDDNDADENDGKVELA
jgi:hypothetical protein